MFYRYGQRPPITLLEMRTIFFLLIIISTIAFFGGASYEIDYYNYANQEIPSYINRDNTPANNQMNDTIATLGRVLFYDKNLSANKILFRVPIAINKRLHLVIQLSLVKEYRKH